MCVLTDGTERPLPPGATLLSDNHISLVWRGHDGWIYKRSITFLIENEFYFLQLMWLTGFVPQSERYDKYTVRLRDLGESEPVTDRAKFKHYLDMLLQTLRTKGIRHGDLTSYSLIVKNNKPYVIDFSESRLMLGTRPDKRPEGDAYWLSQTYHELTNGLS